MLFHSTRGQDNDRTFQEILMQGLASDGGLFMPNEWPKVDLEYLKGLDSFIDVAKHIVPLFTKSSFKKEDVENILDQTWHDFTEKDLIKIIKLNDSISVLELFHGPTAAFKDFGLQLAAAFFNKTLEDQNRTAIVFGATSGDTGSAAIDACKEFESIKSFILLPEGRTSEIQRKQMTTINKSNVFPILIEGTFDDCQDIVKKGFKERNFIRNDQYLLAINSINWIRIIGQICYYFYAAIKLNQLTKPLNYSVPTGNFGNVFACYSASKMGLPLSKIIVAVNSNDILHRFFKNNDYSKRIAIETLSPSMDISVASNFERLLYDFYLDRDANACADLYANFPKMDISIEEAIWQKSKELFLSYSVDDDATFSSMKYFKKEHNYIMDPHTAVAADAVIRTNNEIKGNTLVLSTAHPAKFPDALQKSNITLENIPKRLADVINKKEIAKRLGISDNEVFAYIRNNN
jgi:threonine synthase